MKNKYTEALEKEIKAIDSKNPFANEIKKVNIDTNNNKAMKKTAYYEERKRSSSYFNLILDSDYRDIELEIKGLRYVQFIDPITGKKVVELERKENHYLSEDGAEYVLTELKLHTNPDIKLGHMTIDDYKRTMDLIQEVFSTFMQDSMIVLGMDTEAKQRKGVLLTVAIVNRIRAVYSRSIGGTENKRSHGDISLSGNLEGEKEAKFDLDHARN